MRIKQKIFLIALGLIFVFLLLEGGLRLSRRIYYSYRIENKVNRKDSKDAIRILCLGDSFTFGVGAPKGYSYPEQLQKVLDGNSRGEFIVYNGGIPGRNSSQLFRNLEENIERYAPDVVVILTGCNNNSNLRENNYFLFIDSSMRVYPARLDAYFSNLQCYKLFKAAIINFHRKISLELLKTGCFAAKGNGAFEAPLSKQNKYRKEKVSQELTKRAAECIKLGEIYRSQKRIALAVTEFKKAIEMDPYNDRAYSILGCIYLHEAAYLLDEEARYLLAIELFKKAIELNPSNVPVRNELADAYYRSGKTDLALQELEIIHQLEPSREWISRLLIYGMPDFNDEEIFKKTLKYDLQNIIALILSKRIKLVLLNYPRDWPNDTLREIALKYKLPFVDIESSFKKLESSDGYKRQDYFAEDGHFNANGYRFMAGNVYRVLKPR